MVDLPQLAALDHLARQTQSRHKAVVEGAGVLHAGLLHRLQHGLGFRSRAREGLFADDVLAGLGSGDARLGVGIIWAAVVEELDGVVLDEFAPVGAVALIAVAGGGLPDRGLVAPADGNKRGYGRQRLDHVGNLAESVAMRLTHEGVAQHPYAYLRHVLPTGRLPHCDKTDVFRHSTPPCLCDGS